MEICSSVFLLFLFKVELKGWCRRRSKFKRNSKGKLEQKEFLFRAINVHMLCISFILFQENKVIWVGSDAIHIGPKWLIFVYIFCWMIQIHWNILFLSKPLPCTKIFFLPYWHFKFSATCLARVLGMYPLIHRSFIHSWLHHFFVIYP